MADVPATPRPRKRAASKSHQEPVTPDTPDTPPDPSAPPGNISEAAAAASGKGSSARGDSASPPRARSPRPTRSDKLQSSLTEILSAPALAYAAAGDEWAATFVAKRAPVMAEAWVNLGEENPAVKRILVKLTTGSAWGGVIFATGGTVLPLLIHHNLLPDIGLPLPGGQAEDTGGPIVPPPSEGPPPPGPAAHGGGVGRTPPPPKGHSDMTPPVKPGQPPGVVTVAGTNNQAR